MIKKTVILICSILFFSIQNCTYCDVLKGYVQEVPDSFLGTWRVSAKRIETDSEITFKERTIDLWNISQESNVIKLSNPFSGASAELKVENVQNNTITFTKASKYGNKNLTDKVSITIDKDKFTGTDTLNLDTISKINGSVSKSVSAKYVIKGERIAGQSVIGD